MRIVSLIECSLPSSCHTMRAKYRHALRRRRPSSYNFAASVKINDFTVNMGHYKLQRPSWNPRGQEIKYVVKERILTRGWPKTYHDAKTLKQQRQRGRVEQLNLFLPKLKSLLALGYSRGNKPNGRAVGPNGIQPGTPRLLSTRWNGELHPNGKPSTHGWEC